MDNNDTNNEFLLNLSQDYLEALNDDKYCDIIIEVGSIPNTKKFRAHMVILSHRSPYFQKILTTEENEDDDDDETSTYVKLPDILPETFQTVLRYIYSGKLSLNEHEVPDIIKIMVAASELELKELVTFSQSFLINYKKNWLEQNFDFICQMSYENDSFLELQKFCTDFISERPDRILKSINLSSISKKLMIAIVQSNNLDMSEIQVWNYIIKWGLSQNPELPADLISYSRDNFNALKNTLQDFIPFIGFHNLSSKEFLNEVLPYKRILPKELYMDLLKEFLENDYRPIEKSEKFYSESSHTKSISSSIFDSKVPITSNSKTYNSKISNTFDLKSSSTINSKISNTFDSKISNIFDTRIQKGFDTKSVDSVRMVTVIDSKMTDSIIFDKTNDLKMMVDSKFINLSFVDSKIITNLHTEIISGWIDESNTKDDLKSPFEFKLLFRASRDGFTAKKFHKVCENKTHTVTVIIAEGSTEIFGGYNPITWKSDRVAGVTNDSFIFSFNNEEGILSRVVNEKEAINNGINHGPSFGNEDLHVYRSYLRSELSLYCNNRKRISYERPIREDSGYVGRVKELEVFQIVPLN